MIAFVQKLSNSVDAPPMETTAQPDSSPSNVVPAQRDSWQVVRYFCEPVTAITAPAAEAYFDIYAKSLQALRAATQERSNSSTTRDASLVSSALTVAYSLESKGEARAASREIMTFLDGCLSSNSLVEPNRLLSEADVEKMSSRSLIGLIRSTFVARDHLPAWDGAYTRAWHRAQSLGKNPESLFLGLPKPTGTN